MGTHERPDQARNRALLELTAIFDNASVAIMFSRNRYIERCNLRTSEMFGYDSPQSLTGRPAGMLHTDADSYERFNREARPLLSAGRYFHTEWPFLTANGSTVWVNVYGKAVDPAHTDEGTVWILEDVTQARRTKEALHQTLREMQAIMRNAPVGIGFTRERAMIRYNTRFAEMFGFDGDEVVGKPARILYRSDEDYEAVGRVAGPLLSQGLPFQTELFMRRKDGSDFWATLIGYVQNQEDTREGTIWIIEDRSEFKRAERALQRAHDELEQRVEERTAELRNALLALSSEITERRRGEAEIRRLNAELEQRVVERTVELAAANQELEAFSYSVSHDLRAPLRRIDGFSQMLLEDCADQLDATGREYLGRIRAGTQGMAQLIDDLLRLSRLGRGAISRTSVDLSELAQAVVIELRQQFPERAVELAIAQPLPVNADANLMRIAMENLIGNAWKFSSRKEAGRIELGSVEFQGKPAYFVRDNGAGFDMQYAHRLFNPFQRLHAASEFEGSGIGLAIVQRVILRHGGRVWAEAVPGQGATFYFTLATQ